MFRVLHKEYLFLPCARVQQGRWQHFTMHNLEYGIKLRYTLWYLAIVKSTQILCPKLFVSVAAKLCSSLVVVVELSGGGRFPKCVHRIHMWAGRVDQVCHSTFVPACWSGNKLILFLALPISSANAPPPHPFNHVVLQDMHFRDNQGVWKFTTVTSQGIVQCPFLCRKWKCYYKTYMYLPRVSTAALEMTLEL